MMVLLVALAEAMKAGLCHMNNGWDRPAQAEVGIAAAEYWAEVSIGLIHEVGVCSCLQTATDPSQPS